MFFICWLSEGRVFSFSREISVLISFDLQIGPLSVSKHVIKTTLIVKSDYFEFELNYGIELVRYRQGLRSRACSYND